MTTTTFHCPGCGSLLRTSTPLDEDKKVKCPRCDYLFTARPGGAVASPLPGEARETPRLEEWPGSRELAPALPTGITFPELTRLPLPENDEERSNPTRPSSLSLEDRLARRSLRKPVDRNARHVGLIIGLVLVLLVGGGLAAWFFWIRDNLPGAKEKKQLQANAEGMEDLFAFLPKDTGIMLGISWGHLKTAIKFPEEATDLLIRMIKDKLAAENPELPPGIIDVLFKHSDQLLLAATLQDNEEAVVLFRTARPYQPRDIARLFGATEAHQYQGKTYYWFRHGAADGGKGAATWFLGMPNDRVIILGRLPEKQALEALVSGGAKPRFSPDLLAMARKLKQTHIWFSMFRDQLGQEVSQALKVFVTVPADLQTVVDKLEGVNGLGMSFHFTERLALELDLMCPDTNKAREMARILQNYWDRQLRPQLEQAPLGFGERTVVQEVVNNLKIEAPDKNVVITCHASKKTLQGAGPEMQRRIQDLQARMLKPRNLGP